MAPTTIGVSFKLYFGLAQTVEWCRAARDAIAGSDTECFVVPSAVAIPAAVDALRGTGAIVGAQDLWHEDRGPYTGELGGPILAEAGCGLVEIGHAERRRLFGETDELIALKVAAALRNGVIPLVCVGEPDRGSPQDAAAWCTAQLSAALAVAARDGLHGRVLVAYEPVWAIGAAQSADADHVAAVADAVRARLAQHPVAESFGVLYGGSAAPGTLTALAGSVDGVFLGRFAHDPAAFAAVLDEAATVNRRSDTGKTPRNPIPEA